MHTPYNCLGIELRGSIYLPYICCLIEWNYSSSGEFDMHWNDNVWRFFGMILFLKQTGEDSDNLSIGDNEQKIPSSLSIEDSIKRKHKGGWNSAMVLLGTF